jgi:hypothetical protein
VNTVGVFTRVETSRALLLRALGIFAAGRLVTLAWILGVGAHRTMPMSQTIGYWDGSWYIQAAKGGWPSVVPNLPPETAGQDTTAFFPGYPLLIRLLHLTGLDWPVSALLVTLLAGAVASVLIAVLIESFSTQRVALLTVALWSLQPESFVLSVAYSEALFTALAAGILLALGRQRWLLAGVLAACASGTRSVAAALAIVALVVAARAWLHTPRPQRWTLAGLRPWLAPALSPVGVLGYFAFLRVRVGSWTAWFDVERRGWHMHSDPGVSVVVYSVKQLSKIARFFQHPRGVLVPEGMTPIVLVASVALAVALWRMASRGGTVPLEVWLYGAAFLVLVFITGNSYASLPRILVPAFPLLIPVARWLSNRSWQVTAAVLTGSLAAACYLGVLWFDTIRLATHCCAP